MIGQLPLFEHPHFQPRPATTKWGLLPLYHSWERVEEDGLMTKTALKRLKMSVDDRTPDAVMRGVKDDYALYKVVFPVSAEEFQTAQAAACPVR